MQWTVDGSSDPRRRLSFWRNDDVTMFHGRSLSELDLTMHLGNEYKIKRANVCKARQLRSSRCISNVQYQSINLQHWRPAKQQREKLFNKLYKFRTFNDRHSDGTPADRDI